MDKFCTPPRGGPPDCLDCGYPQETAGLSQLLEHVVVTRIDGKHLAWAAALALLLGFCGGLRAERPEPREWFAGDPHVHRGIGCARSDADRMLTPEELLEMMRPNDLDVISVLGDMGNGEIREAAEDLKLIDGKDHPQSSGGRILHWDAEWHFDPKGVTFEQKAIGGHLIVLGLRHARTIYYEYTHPLIEWAQRQGAVVGFAHMQYLPEGFPEKMTCCDPLEYPVEVALGSGVFLMEDVRGSEPWTDHYYRLLNCGFRPGLAAGTDYPCDSKPLPPLGNLLTYVRVADGKLTYRKWIDGIASGRTVISRSGHSEFLDLKVNGKAGPGDEVKLRRAGRVRVDVAWSANRPLSGRVDLVQNGEVVASREATVLPGRPQSIVESIEFQRSGWICARRVDETGHVVHTSAAFVSVGGKPVRASARDAQFFVQYLDRLLEKTAAGGEWGSYFSSQREEAQARYRAARAVYQRIAEEAARF